jgi:hypothetical protein
VSGPWGGDWDLSNRTNGSSERDWASQTTRLPDGYPAYCIYFPSGFDQSFENNIIEKLHTWGENMGKNLYVAPWKVDDPSYVKILEQIEFKNKPAIVMTDTNNPDTHSYKIVLDNQFLLKDIERLTTVLPVLLDFVLRKDFKEATQTAVKATDKLAVKSMLKAFESKLGKIKITFSYKDGTVTVESK